MGDSFIKQVKIYQKKLRKNKIKLHIEQFLIWVFCFIGMIAILNFSIIQFIDLGNYLLEGKKTTFYFNRTEASRLNTDDKDSLVTTGELPFVSRTEGNDALPASQYDKEIKEVFGDEYQIAKAVMLAESSGNCEAVGDTHLARHSVGLFQISQIYHDYSDETLKNPHENIRIAYEIYQKGGFERWSTFKNGSYLKFL